MKEREEKRMKRRNSTWKKYLSELTLLAFIKHKLDLILVGWYNDFLHHFGFRRMKFVGLRQERKKNYHRVRVYKMLMILLTSCW